MRLRWLAVKSTNGAIGNARMIDNVVRAATGWLALLLVATPATAGTTILQCQKHDTMMKNLREVFKETPKNEATTVLTNGNDEPIGILEMTVSPRGTVTFLTTDANGMTCIQSSGYLLNNGKPKLRGIDS